MSRTSARGHDPDAEFSWRETLLEEYAAVSRDDWVDGKPPPRSRQWLHEHEAELCAAPRTALCLSGGGIRSASFCLGALQALARKEVLGEFNYLSMVSGGGYIGAWLATIMHGGGKGHGALRAANKALTHPTDVALRSLRNYTNFLIPEGGVASSDTWSAIVLWLRNVLLNWLVFGPIMLAVAIVPLFYRNVLWDLTPAVGRVALALGLVSLLLATILVGRSVPTHAYDRTTNPPDGRYGVSALFVQLGIVIPILAWAFLAPLWFTAVSVEQYAATLFVLFGRLGAIIVEQLQTILPWEFWQANAWFRAVLVMLALVLLSLYFGARININRFSLHGVYRNRLARAFIGTGRPPAERKPDAYTRFDPSDNLRMQGLYQGKEHRGYLFPVVNVTLNLLEGAPSGWAERKAAPFTITPLRAGAACLGRTRIAEEAPGRFIKTETYAGQEHDQGLEDAKSGITLGTAMTISGAAVSPSMGYHSSPATAFLMTLFNVRLGAWLPNPGVAQTWSSAKPSNAPWPLFNEMFGRANDKRSNIYLSDGGHFDNLGLYETLRRECCRIVVIDADCDPEYHYADLGRALRLATIDLHVTIDFVAPVMKGETSLNASGALARITYHDGKKGLLLYLKSWLPQNVRADVVAYGAEHEDFPHQSTADQFFTESQFESYRALGEQLVAQAFAAADAYPQGDKLRQVFAREEIAARKPQPMPPGWKGPPPQRE